MAEHKVAGVAETAKYKVSVCGVRVRLKRRLESKVWWCESRDEGKVEKAGNMAAAGGRHQG